MAEIFISIDAELSKSNYYKALVMKQFDENSRNLRISLYNRGEFLRVEPDQIVRANIRRHDEESGVIFGTVNDDGTVNVLLSGWSLAVPGEMKLSVSVIDSSERVLSTASLVINVEEQEFTGSEFPVYTATEDLDADDYYIIVASKPYAFTTTETVPAGGTICFDALMTSASTYDAAGDLLESGLELSEEAEGTHLTGGNVVAFLDSVLLLVSTVRGEKMDKCPSATAGNLVAFDAQGNSTDSGVAAGDLTELSTGKMDKRPGATGGNIVTFDGQGNSHDSGVAVASISALSSQKMSKCSGAEVGDIAVFAAGGSVADSGLSKASVEAAMESTEALDGIKMDKIPTAVIGDFVSFDAYGNSRDSGVAVSDITALSSGKMDRQPNAVEGDFVSFDALGNSQDSGISPAALDALDDRIDAFSSLLHKEGAEQSSGTFYRADAGLSHANQVIAYFPTDAVSAHGITDDEYEHTTSFKPGGIVLMSNASREFQIGNRAFVPAPTGVCMDASIIFHSYKIETYEVVYINGEQLTTDSYMYGDNGLTITIDISQAEVIHEDLWKQFLSLTEWSPSLVASLTVGDGTDLTVKSGSGSIKCIHGASEGVLLDTVNTNLPVAEGSYLLKCIVYSSGEVSFSWVSES